ncbi:VOC family protein [Echinicola vietnamensis]|uniref:Lactoylglutathione lyase-like lyase n=1 Tax=Echinicola vietnamensis (strain DSM 17526 / LMG 23754 / KMM 6221) TaxID=926556 RepID=L0G1L1_ECHVK|nr:VOC family protein [Echinicola vietnamensis]AGA80079.1 lactoylglutathione lyase-like lyase [Echinicola vietnamensis DSM 17526]
MSLRDLCKFSYIKLNNKKIKRDMAGIRRIVPNIYSDQLEATKVFYLDFLGMEEAMDLGWIMTFVSKENPLAQINIFEHEGGLPVNNEAVFMSVEVSDVDGMYRKAKQFQYAIVYDIRDESWGVRRFFVKDPNGATLNILSHLPGK